MRIACIGDSHFDSRPGGRLEECVRVHDWIAGRVRESADLFLHAGDLFEHAKGTTPEERHAAADFLVAASMRHPVFGVRGNHDPALDGEFLTRLGSAHDIAWAELPDVFWHSGVEVDVAVLCLPWPSKAMLHAEGGSEDDLRTALRSIVRGMLQDAQEDHYGKNPLRVILLAHAMISGATTSTGQPLVGTPMHVALEDLRLPGIDVVVLGHIHKPQEWEPVGDLPGVVYTGSSRRTTFGELEEKSILWLNVEAEGPITWTREEIPFRRMVRVEYDLEEHTSGEHRIRPRETFVLDDGDEVAMHVWCVAENRRLARDLADSEIEEMRSYGGATDVKLTLHTVPTQKVRSPEIVQAKTLRAKFEALWAEDPDFGTEDHDRHIEPLQQLIAEAGEESPRARAERALTIERASIRDFGVLRNVEIDFTRLSGVVAIAGRNGAGKTTGGKLVGYASMYRSTLTIDALRDLATSRSARLHVAARGDRGLYEFVHTVDAQTRKSEANVLLDGVPLLEDTKVTSFDRWVSENLQDPSVTLATTFAQQRSRRLVEQQPRERRGVVLRALRLEQLEAVVAAARKGANADEGEVERLEAMIEGSLRGAEPPADIERKLDSERDRLNILDADLAAARDILEDAEAAERTLADMYREALARWEANQGRHRDQTRRVKEARDALVAAKEKAMAALHANRRLADAEQAAQGVDDARAEVERLEREERAAKAASQRAVEDLERVQADHERAFKDVTGLRAQRDAAAGLTVGIERLREESCRLETQIAELELARATATEIEQQLREQRATHEGGTQTRIKGLRGGLVSVHECGIYDEAKTIASATLEEDDELAARTQQAPRAIVDLEEKLADALTVVTDGMREQSRLALNAERFQRAEEAAQRVADCDARLLPLEESLAEIEQALAAARTDKQERIREWEVKGQALAAARRHAEGLSDAVLEVERMRRHAGNVEALERAAADAEALVEQEARLLEEIAADVGEKPVRSSDDRLAEARNAVNLQEQRRGNALDAVKGLEAKLAEAARAWEAVSEWRSSVRRCRDSARVLRRIQRDGERIRLLEIDGAGPRVGAVANALLALVRDGRWSLELITSKPYADASRADEEQDVYEILVHDAGDEEHQPRTADITKYSGGELTILSEALSLALTVVAAEHAGGAAGATIFRDESGAALDGGAGPEYVDMMRQALGMIGSPLAMVVTHDEGVIAAADGVLRAGSNTWEVER